MVVIQMSCCIFTANLLDLKPFAVNNWQLSNDYKACALTADCRILKLV
jgi:hypothetical protein